MNVDLTPATSFRLAGLIALALLGAGPARAQSDELVDLIAEACAPCHGDDGIAKSVDVPNLAGQHKVYLYNQLRAFRTGKRPHKEMRFMSRQMTDDDMRAIADYYSRLPPR
jgi:cytochrome c553